MDYTLIVKLTNNCNLNCSYCYHRRDESRNISLSLSRDNLELMIAQFMRHNEKKAQFIWHGGEPLLVGIDTFRFIVRKQREYNQKGLAVYNSVQTNGTLLDEEYMRFFRDNHFSIGISIDGPFDMHTAERKTTKSEYAAILKAIDALSRRGARFGTLCVLGKQHIRQEQRLFDLLVEHGITHIGFLPCIVPTANGVDEALTLLPEEYGRMMINLFEIWINSGVKHMSIRNFDECIRFFRGRMAQNCTSLNECDQYLTITPDGGIYLCDNFSANEEHKAGELITGFDGLETTPAMVWLKDAMTRYPPGCEACPFFGGCYGGCKYQRWVRDRSMQGRQYHCQATKMLYAHIGKYISRGEG